MLKPYRFAHIFIVIFILVRGSCAGPIPPVEVPDDDICGEPDFSQLVPQGDIADDEEAAKIWLGRHDQLLSVVYCQMMVAEWNYNTNLTDYNLKNTMEVKKRVAAFENEAYDGAMTFNWQNFSAPVRRQFASVVDIGYSVLSDTNLDRINQLGAELERTYSIAKVCNKPGDPSNNCYPLDPDLTEVMATSRNWEELEWAWEGWREASGNQMADSYREYIALQNEAAVLNGYADGGAYWRSWYETPDFDQMCAKLWEQVRPLYEQLHAYVRRKLRLKYPDHDFPASGHIPAHLLGNMWAQQWNNIENIIRPFPDSPGVDVTGEMKKQGYNIERMFRLSEEFFVSLGLDPMVESFWNDSMLARPKDREVVCHASAWDFYTARNFRVKQCTEINMEWLFTTHHEMGHIVYFMEYKDQPVVYRDGANPGFHEAIGDIMELSVSTPEHLDEIGLLPEFQDSEEMDLNFLMEMALRKVAFLPFGYLIDQWRWSVFSGRTTPETYNRDWWNLRCAIQGLTPPSDRSSSDFDPGAKYHVPGNTPYIRYFISYVLQFQLHKHLCAASNNTAPLHRCDIYQSKEAGRILRQIMQHGGSKPWPEVLQESLGTPDMDIQPMVEYFEPLLDFLQKSNNATGERVGWDETCQHGIS